MHPDLLHIRNELLQWISELQDEETILEIIKIKNAFENLINEPKAEYIVKDDFEERWARGLTKEQSIEKTKSKIREWWGK